MIEQESVTRSFICIDLPEHVIKEIARVQELLSAWKFTGSMTRLENVHLTLKFLGELTRIQVEEARKKLQHIVSIPFQVKLLTLGVFHHHSSPKIVWVKLGGKGIFQLQKNIDRALEGLFKKEKRFMSHMTIARVKYVKDKEGFEHFVKQIKIRELEWEAREFFLKKSVLEPQGSAYSVIEHYSFDSDGSLVV